MFIDAFLGLCSAVSVGACSEFAMTGYARQPISFSRAVNGISKNSISWTFGNGFSGTIAGRAVFDAPTAGNLLFVLPHYVPKAPGCGPIDSGDVADVVLVLSALAPFANSDAATMLLPAGSVVGSTYDITEIIGTVNSANGAPTGASVYQMGPNQFRFAYASPLSTGPGQLAINRGTLQLQARAEGIE